jgi:SAM-dependent methyltransferase
MSSLESTPSVIGFIGADPADDGKALALIEKQYEYYDLNYREHLPENKKAVLLDYGCGAGGFLRYMEGLGYRNLVGFEPDTRYARYATSQTSAQITSEGNEVPFLQKNSGKFDFVFTRQVLYYIPRESLPERFTQLITTLKPGGIFLCEVVNGAGLSGLWPYMNDPYIRNVFSETSLKFLCANNNLEILSLKCERTSAKGLKGKLWLLGRFLWGKTLRIIYTLERGLDPNNPTLFGKNLILVAKRR